MFFCSQFCSSAAQLHSQATIFNDCALPWSYAANLLSCVVFKQNDYRFFWSVDFITSDFGKSSPTQQIAFTEIFS